MDPPGPCCQGKRQHQDSPQPRLSCHLLLAARAQIGNQDLIHLIRVVSIPDPARLPPANPFPPTPPTPSRLICTALISRTANFSIWPLFTQGAQAMLIPMHPPQPPGVQLHATGGRPLTGYFGVLAPLWTSTVASELGGRLALSVVYGQALRNRGVPPLCPDGIRGGQESHQCPSLPCRLAITGTGYS